MFAQSRIGTAEWISTLTDSLTTALLAWTPTPYERLHLLRLLSITLFHPKYPKLYATLSLALSNGLDIDLHTPPPVVLALFISNQLYQDARAYARVYSLSPHHITVAHVEHRVNQVSQTHLGVCFVFCHRGIARIFLHRKCEHSAK